MIARAVAVALGVVLRWGGSGWLRCCPVVCVAWLRGGRLVWGFGGFLVFVWFVGSVWPLGRSLLAVLACVCGGVRFVSSAGFGLGRSRLAGFSGWALSVGGGCGRWSRLGAALGGGVFSCRAIVYLLKF